MASSTKTSPTQSKGKPNKKKPNVFHQRLGSLTYYQAGEMLGDDGSKLIRRVLKSLKFSRIETSFWAAICFAYGSKTPMSMAESPSPRSRCSRLALNSCKPIAISANCLVHISELPRNFSSTPNPFWDWPCHPTHRCRWRILTDDELLQRAMAERQERAVKEPMSVRSMSPDQPWVDYVVTSKQSGRSYRVALRGLEAGESFCTCPDFRTNHLGTCKHILQVQTKVQKRFPKKKLKPYRRKRLSVRVSYGANQGVVFNVPHKADAKIEEIVNGVTSAH